MIDPNANYKFSYTRDGKILPPDTSPAPFGSVLILAAFLFPFLPYLHLHTTCSPFVAQYLPNFWALRRAGFLSDGNLALIEMATGLWLLSRLVQFVIVRRQILSLFSKMNPPPQSLRDRWPGQFSRYLALGGVFMLGPFVLGPVTYFLGILNAKYAFIILALFGGGCLFITEGLMSLGLYSAFKSRFWSYEEDPPSGR